MKRLATVVDEAAAKRERHRKYEWCRLRNDFIDDPLWRLVAERLGLPLYQVQAFVTRLDSFANAGEQRGGARGYVGDFEAPKFAVALGMPAEQAARIFAEIEHPDVGWVVQDHVVNFWQRNPDKEDLTAAERQRRLRARRDVRKSLARLAALGLIEGQTRTAVERELDDLADDELGALKARLRRALAAGAAPELSTEVSRRYAVMVTPRADHISKKEADQPVDNSGAASRGAAAAPSDQDAGEAGADPQAEALLWLSSTGLKIVTERLDELKTQAEGRMERWLHQRLRGDAVALRAIIESVRASDATVAKFLGLISDGIARARRSAQPELRLPPGLSTGSRHAVTPPAVGNAGPAVDNAATEPPPAEVKRAGGAA